ncbi:MAG: hypothetical protein Q8K64_10730 [Sediminibacterium sp.]|nr:hypothetical protein [Sediminibacterium sp.]
MLNFWKRRYNEINYNDLLRTLENGSLDETHSLLAQNQRIKYLNGVESMLEKYRKPDGENRNLTLHSTQQHGEFELAILNVPWNSSSLPFLPLILQRSSGTIYGIMLPFNELLPELTAKQQSQIGELGMSWTKFAIEHQIGVKF